MWNIRSASRKLSDSNAGYAGIFARITGRQSDIVPPEKPTSAWWTLNLTAGQRLQISGEKREKPVIISLTLTAENILNKKYFDHTSYYRLIDVPEAGWNLTIMLGVDF